MNYIHEYHTVKRDEASARLLRFKDGQPKAVEYYRSEILKWCRSNIEMPHIVVAVPCHLPFVRSSMDKLLPELCKEYPLLSTEAALIKRFKTPSMCRTNRRRYPELLRSIGLVGSVTRKHLLVLDDVTTTGTSFKVAEHILLNADASTVTCLALAKTV